MQKFIERSMGYYENKPVMILRSAGHDNRKRFIIKLDDLWKYSDTHNKLFEDFMANQMIKLCMLFEIDVPKEKSVFVKMMANMSETIMSGIDDLVKLKPYTEGTSDPDMVIDKAPKNEEQPVLIVH